MQAFLVKKKEKTHLWRACAYGDEIPTQAEAVTGATSTVQAEYKSLPDLDYLQVMCATSSHSFEGWVLFNVLLSTLGLVPGLLQLWLLVLFCLTLSFRVSKVGDTSKSCTLQKACWVCQGRSSGFYGLVLAQWMCIVCGLKYLFCITG